MSKYKNIKAQEEKKLSYMVAEFIKTQYPKVIHRFDVAADLRMSINQASIIKNKLLHEKGFTDLVIFEPSKGYHGLLIELKKDYAEVYKKDGSYKKNEHLETQIAMHKRLRDKGYCVVFGLGFDDTIEKIRGYFAPVGKDKINEKQGSLI